MKQLWTVLLVVLVIGALLSVAIHGKYQVDVDNALHAYRHESAEATRRLAGEVSETFRAVYQGLRTIARIPGVRSIDRYADQFDDDARQTVQEIYNNLANNVVLSEVYIVPLGMDPDRWDSRTGIGQAPSITFDEVILRRTAQHAAAAAPQPVDCTRCHAAPDGTRPPPHIVDQMGPVEEIEIYEYRVMRDQLAWFAQQYPEESSIEGLHFPAHCGPEVITCDNSRYDPRQADNLDRSGLVYSVPFFGPDGKLKGCISGVFLTHTLRDLLPGPHFTLENRARSYRVAKPGDTTAAADPDQEPLYAEVLTLPVTDVAGAWILHARRPDSAFWQEASVVGARQFALVAHAGTWLLLLVLGGLYAHLLVRRRELHNRRAQLEAEVKHQTQELRAAVCESEEANQAKSMFLSNMSHELRTPLHAILSFSDLGMRRLETASTEKIRNYLGKVQASGRTLLALVNELLDLAKLESGSFDIDLGDADFGEVVKSTVDEFWSLLSEQQKNVRLAGDLPAAAVVGSTDRLKQVVRNLLSNAIKFSPADGVIDVVLSCSDGVAHLDVCDDGPGIPAKELESVFDKFTQSTRTRNHAGGTGLGLSICREIVMAHNGRIWAENSPDRGARFCVEIPLDPSRAVAPSEELALPS